MAELWAETEYPVVALSLTQEHRCLQCRRVFDQPWLVATGQPWPHNVVLNAEIAWHWQDTHGFAADDLAQMVGISMGFFGGVPV